MSSQRQYYQNRGTGELFTWSAADGAYISTSNRRVVYRNDPEATRIAAVAGVPRTTLTSSTAADSSAGAYGASQDYTHRPRGDTGSSNGSGGQTPAQPIRRPSGPATTAAPIATTPYSTSLPPQTALPYRMNPSASGSASGGQSSIGPQGAPRPAAPTDARARDWTPNAPVPATGAGRLPGGQTPGVQRPDTSDSTVRHIRDPALQELDKRYKRRHHDFFRPGRVFLVHWAEPAGGDNNATVITDQSEILQTETSTDPRFGQKIYSKIRRFIVIRQAGTYSTCVRITTYGRRGVAKRDVTKSEHAIAYLGHQPPQPHRDENPNVSQGEWPMRRAIRIQPDEPGDKLEPMSRIDYGRIYTVEHNVKARSFGFIHRDSERDFSYTFRAVQNLDDGILPSAPRQSQQAESSDRGSAAGANMPAGNIAARSATNVQSNPQAYAQHRRPSASASSSGGQPSSYRYTVQPTGQTRPQNVSESQARRVQPFPDPRSQRGSQRRSTQDSESESDSGSEASGKSG